MLELVRIRDYALIEQLDIEFQPGFNALSGETGAGKSIVVGALGLALGARASSDTVRADAAKASVEAVFRLDAQPPELVARLDAQGIPIEDGLLILSRTVTTDGRSRAQVNGHLVTIAALAAIGDELVDLHGQHEHQSLLRPERQLALLDGFAGTTEEARVVGEAVSRLNKMKRDIADLEADDRDRARQLDFWRYEVNEIDKAGLTPGEEAELRERLHLITHAETIHTLASNAYAALYESDETAAIDSLDAALRDLETLEGIDRCFAELRAQVAEARAGVESAAESLRGHTTRLEFDPEELDGLNARLALIGDLKRKYGPDVERILAYRDQAAASIAEYDNRDERLAALHAEYKQFLSATEQIAAALSEKRRKAAGTMDAQVRHLLRSLDMPHAKFETQIETVPLCASGMDKVAFMLAANIGEPLKPLKQVASGGEISRIMLALKAVFAEQDTVPTLIFDEIDAGVGGTAARRVAETLATLANTHQIVCITHLPQIAAAANAHYRVIKKEEADRTRTQVEYMPPEARQAEIARLLDGSVSAVSLDHGRALLAEFDKSQQKRNKGKKR